MIAPCIMIGADVFWLDKIDPYKAVDYIWKWRLSFNNDNTKIEAQMLLQKVYRKRWKKVLFSLMKKNEKKEN